MSNGCGRGGRGGAKPTVQREVEARKRTVPRPERKVRAKRDERGRRPAWRLRKTSVFRFLLMFVSQARPRDLCASPAFVASDWGGGKACGFLAHKHSTIACRFSSIENATSSLSSIERIYGGPFSFMPPSCACIRMLFHVLPSWKL
eukprot:scaffold868_cov351-Pavlova_lutheri.AAC.17